MGRKHYTEEQIASSAAAEVAPSVRILQIIHGALISGVAVYFVYLWSNGLHVSADEGTPPLVPLGVAVLGAVMSGVAPSIVRHARLEGLRGHPQIATDSLVATYQAGHIIGMATLEGAAFFAGFALTGRFGEPPWWFPVVPIALLGLMVIRFPRVASIADWVSMAREELALPVPDSADPIEADAAGSR